MKRHHRKGKRDVFTKAGPVKITVAAGFSVIRPPYPQDYRIPRSNRSKAERRRLSKLPIELKSFSGPLRHIPFDLREMVWKRDMGACRYCGQRKSPFELDHVVPFSKGGATTLGNLVLACRPCNQRKWTKTWKPASLDKHRARIAAEDARALCDPTASPEPAAPRSSSVSSP